MIKPKTTRVPRTRAGGEWTEAGYWQFIRGCFRAGARRYPPIVRQALEAVKRPSQSTNKRLKWEYQCVDCVGWFPRKEVQVDHIEECGTLRSYADLPGFVERMFCEPARLAIRCKACHELKTNARRESNGKL